jgi:hypothetical protein
MLLLSRPLQLRMLLPALDFLCLLLFNFGFALGECELGAFGLGEELGLCRC